MVCFDAPWRRSGFYGLLVVLLYFYGSNKMSQLGVYYTSDIYVCFYYNMSCWLIGVLLLGIIINSASQFVLSIYFLQNLLPVQLYVSYLLLTVAVCKLCFIRGQHQRIYYNNYPISIFSEGPEFIILINCYRIRSGMRGNFYQIGKWIVKLCNSIFENIYTVALVFIYSSNKLIFLVVSMDSNPRDIK